MTSIQEQITDLEESIKSDHELMMHNSDALFYGWSGSRFVLPRNNRIHARMKGERKELRVLRKLLIKENKNEIFKNNHTNTTNPVHHSM